MGSNCGTGMQEPLSRGMSFIVSTWSAYDADWLVKGKCEQKACNLDTLKFSNLVITTNGIGPEPIPTPEYTYGDSCATPYDDECDGCDCHFSWPVNSDWNDPDAMCRCK